MSKNLLGSILIGASLLYGNTNQAQCYNCGNGSEGQMVISSNQTLSGEHHYTYFRIDAGVVVTVTGNTPLIIHATQDVLINGTIDANGLDGNGRVAPAQSNGGGGKGGDGGTGTSSAWAPGTNGSGPGGGLGATCDDNMGGGGAGFYKPYNGGGGGCNTSGGPGYADKYILDLPAGSGGGGGSGYSSSPQCFGNSGCGGGGGGAIAIFSCGKITIGNTGSIQANGGSGFVTNRSGCLAGGNGGGGSGGSIYLSSAQNSVINNGTLDAKAPFLGGINGFASGINGVIRIDGVVSGSGSTGSAYKYNPNYFDSAVVALIPLAPCAGQANGKDSLVLKNLGTGFQINWSNGDTSQVIKNLSSGSYSVTVTNVNGCTKVLSNVIANPDAIAGNIVTTPTASNTGKAIPSPTGGTPPYTYQWSNGLPGDTGKNYAPGSFNVTITDANGCSATEQFTISLSTGIDDINNVASIGLYPNPANDKLFVTTQQPTTLFITNAFGQIVLEGNTGHSSVFNVSSLSPGIYFIQNQNLSAKARFIKQ